MQRAVLALTSLLLVGGCQRRPSLTTAPRRTLAARVSYAALDVWRPLDERAGSREAVSLAAFDGLARRRDWHGVAALALIGGAPARAADALARAPRDLDTDADRALLSLLRDDVDDALERLDGVLAARPRHAQARWNRGLALAALDLPLAAAQAFDGVAALGEPGWSDEARQRAAALRHSWDERVARADEAVGAGKAMLRGGPPPPDALVRRFPSLTRHYFYHSVRAAPSLERLAALRPLARTLDNLDGDGTLTRWLDRVAREAPAARALLAPRYGRYVLMPSSPPAIDPAEQRQFFDELRRAGADDLRLGSLVVFDGKSPAELDELRRLVAANGDPWWQAVLDGTEARAIADGGDLAAAARRLRSAIERCQTRHLDYRCAFLHKQLALVDVAEHHTSDARRAAVAAVATARDVGMIPRFLETSTIFLLGDIARYRNDFPLMRAYLAEGMLRVPDNCAAQRKSHLMLGIEDIFKLAFDDAARELAATPACDHSFPLLAADLVTSLALAGHPTPQAEMLPAELAAARPSLSPSERRLADVMQARLLLGRDREAALALLRPALAPARTEGDADAKKARTFAYQMLAVDAGRRGDFGAAVDALAAEAGAAPAERCAVGVALDDNRTVVAARTADGRALGHYDPARRRPEVDAAQLVPATVRAALVGCAEVSVYALAPLHGQPGLLPPELAWSYRMGRAEAALPSALPPRRLVVSDVLPPPSLALPPLLPWRATSAAAPTVWLAGAAATPARTVTELGDATEIEFNAHGLIDLDLSDTWLLALSPDADGRFALTAAELQRQRLRGHPLVVLAACYAGRAAPYLHEPWSLPMALIDAGARAVFASAAAIPDASAGPFFDGVMTRVHAGQSPSTALRDERLARLREDPGSWTRQVLLFQ